MLTERSRLFRCAAAEALAVGYDGATGFLTSQNLEGLGQSFEPNSDGTVAAVQDGLGHRTTYRYSWGRVSEIRTAHVTTTIDVNPDGTIAWSGIGASAPRTCTTTRFASSASPPRIPIRCSTTMTMYGTSATVSRGSAVELDSRRWLRSCRPDARAGWRLHARRLRRLWTRHVRERALLDRSRARAASPPPMTASAASGPPRRPMGASPSVTYTGLDVSVTTPVSDTESGTTTYHYRSFGAPTYERLMGVTDASGQTTSYK